MMMMMMRRRRRRRRRMKTVLIKFCSRSTPLMENLHSAVKIADAWTPRISIDNISVLGIIVAIQVVMVRVGTQCSITGDAVMEMR
ncbi:hypothetical protein ACHAXH_005772 [Discostella pseudostelligera]